MQVGGGVNNACNFYESALDGIFHTLRYIFSDEKQKDLYKSLGGGGSLCVGAGVGVGGVGGGGVEVVAVGY